MNFKVKKLRPDAILPQRAHDTDSGWDLHVLEWEDKGNDLYFGHTGIAIESPPSYYIELVGRSSLPKHGLRLANGLGIVDFEYHGEIIALIERRTRWQDIIHVSRYYLPKTPLKAVQMVFHKISDVDGFEVVEELGETDRGEGGFGSSDKGTK